MHFTILHIYSPSLFYYALVKAHIKGSLIQIIAICLWFSCTFAFWGTLFRNPQNNLYVDFNERHLFAWYSAPILTIENSWEKSLYIMLTSISRTWLSIERTFFCLPSAKTTWLCGLFLPFFGLFSVMYHNFSIFSKLAVTNHDIFIKAKKFSQVKLKI